MIVLDQVFYAVGLPGWWIGNYSNFLLGIFLSFRTILKMEYKNNLQRGVLLGISTSILFIVYVSVIVGTSHEYLTFDYWLRVWVFRIFLSSLIGCLTGFLLGGSKLQRMPPPKISVAQPAEKRTFAPVERGGVWIVLFLVVGAVLGYFAGYVVWIIFGQIQLLVGIAFPYAALLPPPLIYQIAWTIMGALAFPFKILPEIWK